MDPTAIAAAGLGAAEGLSKIPAPIAKLFPGIAEWSISRARRGARRRALDEVAIIREKALEAGLSKEAVERLCANILRDATGDDNFLEVAIFASGLVGEGANTSEVDPSWADTFRSHAEKAYDDDARRTWGMLLAGELDSPGTYSKRTMSILADMSREDALAFQELCRNAILIKDGDTGKLAPMLTMDAYNSLALDNDERAVLNALGITNFPFGILQTKNAVVHGETVVRIGKHDYVLKCDTLLIGHPGFEVVDGIFTKYGAEMFNLYGPEDDDALEERTASQIASCGLTVLRVDEWVDESEFLGTQVSPLTSSQSKDGSHRPNLGAFVPPTIDGSK